MFQPFQIYDNISYVTFDNTKNIIAREVTNYSSRLIGMARKSNNKNAENGENVNSGERDAFAKNPEMEKHFLDLCLREVNAEGYKGVSLTTDSWKRLRKEFNEKWGVDYNHKKFRNHYDYLRGDFSLWLKMIGTSGHGVSGDNESLLWPPQKWKEVIEASQLQPKLLISTLYAK